MGLFIVNSVIEQIDNNMLANGFYATRLCNYVPRNVNIFIWHILLCQLPSRLGLKHKCKDVTCTLCSICQNHPNDENHIFIFCDLAKEMWMNFRSGVICCCPISLQWDTCSIGWILWCCLDWKMMLFMRSLQLHGGRFGIT